MRVKAWPALALGAAFWPVWRWYFQRLGDGGDEPYGLLALAALALLRRSGGGGSLEPAALLTLLYALTWPFFPPLAHALLALGAMGSLCLRAPGQSGLWGLLALSLPVTASLQFYLGYPLRLAAAVTTATVLQAGGCPVGREGSLLRWRGEGVLVDAPCSGVHMLWFGLCLACALAAFYRLSGPRTLLALAASAALVIAANLLRATILFFREAGLVAWPAWTHPATGLLCFAAAAWLTLLCTRCLQPSLCASASPSSAS